MTIDTPNNATAGPSIVDGDWEMTLSTPVGPQTFTGHFETNGNEISGYLKSPQGTESFTGTVDGGHVVFDLKATKPVKITLKYNFVVEGDTLAGKCKMGIFGSAKLKGKRL